MFVVNGLASTAAQKSNNCEWISRLPDNFKQSGCYLVMDTSEATDLQ
jgi:hypothetical protein